MKKTVFLVFLSLGYWLVAYHAIAYDVNCTDLLTYHISYTYENAYSLHDGGSSVGFGYPHFWNDGSNFDLRVGNGPFPNDGTYPLTVSARISRIDMSHRITEAAAPVPEPATMFLFGIGLIFLAESGRRLKKQGIENPK